MTSVLSGILNFLGLLSLMAFVSVETILKLTICERLSKLLDIFRESLIEDFGVISSKLKGFFEESLWANGFNTCTE